MPTWQGQPRKLMLHASRNGFFYVFDRANGTLLLAKAVRQEPDLGERHRRRRPPDQAARSGADARRARKCARRRTARPTGSRRPTTHRPGSTTCRRSRSAASTPRRDQGEWESGKTVSRRLAADRSRSEAAAHAQGDRYSHRRDQLGAAAARARRSRGAARWPRRRASSSSAKKAAR